LNVSFKPVVVDDDDDDDDDDDNDNDNDDDDDDDADFEVISGKFKIHRICIKQ
jgi:hypothetical protein